MLNIAGIHSAERLIGRLRGYHPFSRFRPSRLGGAWARAVDRLNRAAILDEVTRKGMGTMEELLKGEGGKYIERLFTEEVARDIGLGFWVKGGKVHYMEGVAERIADVPEKFRWFQKPWKKVIVEGKEVITMQSPIGYLKKRAARRLLRRELGVTRSTRFLGRMKTNVGSAQLLFGTALAAEQFFTADNEIHGTFSAAGVGVGMLLGAVLPVGPLGAMLADYAASVVGEKIYELGAEKRIPINITARTRMGGYYRDSRQALTMRQRAVMEMQRNALSSRRLLGQEGFIFHQ